MIKNSLSFRIMLQFAEGRQRNWGRGIDQIVFLLLILASSDYENNIITMKWSLKFTSVLKFTSSSFLSLEVGIVDSFIDRHENENWTGRMQNHKLELIGCWDVKQLYRMGKEKKNKPFACVISVSVKILHMGFWLIASRLILQNDLASRFQAPVVPWVDFHTF